ncbi:hypothetical protein D3C76_28170 [compost metagenome]
MRTRLTSGNAPLHVRRKYLTNILREAVHSCKTTMTNWPDEFMLPEDHDIHELLRITETICDDLENPDGSGTN